jgi:hypothetical protein
MVDITASHLRRLLTSLPSLTELRLSCLNTDARFLVDVRRHPALKKLVLEGFHLPFVTQLNLTSDEEFVRFLLFCF